MAACQRASVGWWLQLDAQLEHDAHGCRCRRPIDAGCGLKMGGAASAERHENSLRYGGWRVVLVCFAMAVVCWGFGFYGHAFYLAELQRQHGWPASLVSSATTAYYLVSA